MAGLVAAFVFAAQMLNFPVGRRHQRAPAGRRAGRGPGRPVDRRALPRRRAAGAGAALRRRRHHRARHQHHALRRRRRRRSAGWCSAALQARAARSGSRWSPVAAGGRARSCRSRSTAAGLRRLLFAVGGQAPVAARRRLTAMLGWHVLIGIGEALITGARGRQRRRRPARPGARRPAGARRPRSSRSAAPATVAGSEDPHASCSPACSSRCCSPASRSYYASSHPDGLEYVAEQTGFLDTADDSAGRRRPAGRLRGHGRRQRRARGGLAGVIGVLVTLGLAGGVGLRRAPRDSRPTTEQPTSRTGLMGAGHGHRLHFHGHSPVHRARAAPEDPGPARASCWSSSPRRASGTRRTPATSPCSLARDRGAAGCRSATCCKRLVVEVPFVVFALLMPFIAHGPAGRGARDRGLSEPGLLAAWGLLAKGTLGVLASLTLAATTEPARPAARPAAAAAARPARADHGLHDPLPRRGHRRDAADAHRDALARLRPALAPALAGPGQGRSARCSSAPTSAASGSTSRCCRAATPAGCPCMSAPRSSTSAASPTPTPTATRRCSASTSTSTRASGSRCSARTAPARRRWCCTSTASSPPGAGTVAVSGLPVVKENLQEIRRRVGIVFQDPDDQLFLGTVRAGRRLRPGQPRAARARRWSAG